MGHGMDNISSKTMDGDPCFDGPLGFGSGSKSSSHGPRYEALRMEVAAKLRVGKLRILVRGTKNVAWIDG